MKSVLVASRNKNTCGLIFTCLNNNYELSLLKSVKILSATNQPCDLFIIDSENSVDQEMDLIAKFKASNNAPILFLTAVESTADAIHALAKGATNYLIKVDRFIQLLPCTVELLLNQHEELCQLRKANRKLIAHIKSVEEQAKKSPYTPSVNLRNPIQEIAVPNLPDPSPQLPKEPLTLIERITQRLKQGEINLPSIPDFVLKVNQLVDSHASIAQIAKLVSNDTAITTSLIRISNSSRYRGVSQNQNLEQAINRLGIEQSMVYVQMISNRSLFATKDPLLAPLFNNLWAHSMACAHTSQVISEKLSIGNCFDIFMMGLLHDIGTLFLLQILAEVRVADIDFKPSKEELHQLIEDYHENFGKSLLQRWRFPAPYIEVTAFHEHPEKCTKITDQLLVINLSNRIINALGYQLDGSDEQSFKLQKSDTSLGLNEALVEEISAQSQELIENFKADTGC